MDRDRQLAHYYDLEYAAYSEDVDFYVQYAGALDGERELPVLELGCGTGRVLVALAGAGFRVVGVDRSEGMLEVCAARAEANGAREQVRLVQADMRDLGDVPDGAFNMAFCALNTFAYLRTTDDQMAMLRAACELLVGHGILIVDLTPPMRHLLPPSGGEVVYQGSYPDEESRATLHKFVTGYEEPSTQSHHVQTIYDLEAEDGTLRRLTEPQMFRWTGRYEMQLLLERAGYRLEKVYGDYELGEYGDESERMIFVARKAVDL
ncbi:MAG: class I SAM-dependent methyltransferase [Chloroflexia bacterium]